MQPPRLLVVLVMVTTMVMWGVSFVASSVLLARITPTAYMAVRFVLAVAVLALVVAGRRLVRGRGRGGDAPITPRTHALIAATALAEPVAYFLFESYGIRLTGPTPAALVIATIPLAVMVVARVILGEPIDRRAVVAFLASVVGIGLLLAGSGGGPDASLRSFAIGVALVFGAVLSAAFYITLARGLSSQIDALRLTTLQTMWGALVFVVVAVVAGGGRDPVSAVTAVARDLGPTGWGAMAFLVVGATVVAFLLYNWALRHESAGRAALFINAIPLVTAVTGAVVLGERLTPLQIVGGIIVLGAVRAGIGSRARPRTGRFSRA